MSSKPTSVPRPPRRIVTRVLLPLIIVVCAVLALLWSGWNTLAPALPVTVLQVVAKDGGPGSSNGPGGGSVGTAIQAPGWVEPSPFPVAVSALTPGIVKSVLVLEGERVIEGQVLVELYNEDQTIALKLSEAMLLEAQAKRNEVVDEHRRKKSLVESGAVPRAEVARLAIRTEAMDAGVAAAEAERDMRVLALERTLVRAPVAGVVMSRLVTPGMSTGNMETGKPLIELYDPAHLQVRADVPLADAGLIAPGQKAEIRVDVLPNRTFAGEVIRLAHQADIAKNTVQAKVRVVDPAPELKPDMLARVKIMAVSAPADGGTAGAGTAGSGTSGGTRRVQLWAPLEGMHRTNGSATEATALVAANVVDGVGIAEARTLRLDGAAQDGMIAVADGLRAGDLLISTSGAQPTPGQRVRVDLEALRTTGAPHGNH